MAKDYYESLDLDKSASAEDIKKAYRKLALKYHPDHNQGDAEAEAKFKEVSEAYSVLSDPDKRAAYDRLGHEAFTQRGRGGGGGSPYGPGVDPFDIFSQVFGEGGLGGSIFEEFFGGGGGRSRRSGPAPGADLRYDLRVPFEDAVYGAERIIQIQRAENCDRCRGEGMEPGTRKRRCEYCNGVGQVSITQGFFSIRQPCPKCHGQGEIIEDPCKDCRGEGRVQVRRKIRLKIPPGADTGSRMKVSGQGEPGIRGGPPGDLYVVFHVDEHDVFKRHGNDVMIEVPIPFTTAALGGTVRVPTISGAADLKVPAGTQTDAVFRLKEKGIPSAVGQGRGDQMVKVVVEVPKNLSRAQREKLEEFAEACDSSVHPRLADFLEKVKKFFT